MAFNLPDASPDKSGITATHITAIETKCREKNVFLIVRPSEKQTMTLIDRGFACKNMDIHDKSSNWGLMAGMVTPDPRFSKKKTGDPITDVNNLKKAHGHAETVHLQFKHAWMNLIGSHFLVNKLSPPSWDLNRPKPPSNCKCGGITYGQDRTKQWIHYNDDANGFCFLMSPEKKIYWRWLNKGQNGSIGEEGVPLYVWAYNGLPVTGDYDVWMLAPHINHATKKESADIVHVHSKKDAHGRSAATDFYSEFLTELNSVCPRPTGGNVFHHGAESQNFSFTQDLDYHDNSKNTVFCPGTHKAFLVDNRYLPRLIFEMLRHGYVATINPKWRMGVTLGAEDMAYARDAVVGRLNALKERNSTGFKGSDALANLETDAALRIQRAFRRGASASPKTQARGKEVEAITAKAQIRALEYRSQIAFAPDKAKAENEAIDNLNKDFWGGTNRGMALSVFNQTKLADRMKKLKLMRQIAQATDLPFNSDPDSADLFPSTCFVDASRTLADSSRLLAQEQEKSFRRTGFASDGHGGLTPIDRTRGGGQ